MTASEELDALVMALTEKCQRENTYDALYDDAADAITTLRAQLTEALAVNAAMPAAVDAQIEADAWQPIETAPKDGSILRLFIDYSVEDGCGALEDAETAWTIGFNQLVDTGDDVWEFAGWDWGGDCFTQGHGKVIGWLPFHSSSVPEHAPVPRGSVQVDSDSVMNYADCSNAPLRLVAHMTKNERLALSVCDMRKAASEIQRVELDRHTAEHLAQDLAKMLELDNPTKGPKQCPQ